MRGACCLTRKARSVKEGSRCCIRARTTSSMRRCAHTLAVSIHEQPSLPGPSRLSWTRWTLNATPLGSRICASGILECRTEHRRSENRVLTKSSSKRSESRSRAKTSRSSRMTTRRLLFDRGICCDRHRRSVGASGDAAR